MSKRVAAVAMAVIAIPAVWQITLLVYTIASRIAFPYDLEWMEGGLLDHAARIQEGSGIYGPPSVEFIPYLYTPLYPALLALIGEPLGLSYGLGRTVGVLALMLAMGVIATAALRPTRANGEAPGYRIEAVLAGVLGCGLVASAYPWLEGWYDIVRGDMLFVAMVLIGLAVLVRPTESRERPGRRDFARVAAAAALLALSFFCKQHGIWFVAAGGLALVAFRRWRLIPVYVGVAGVIGLGFSWLLERSTDGWFWTYIYEILRTHDFQMPRFRSAFPNMLGRAPVATVIVGATIVAVVVARIRGTHPGPQSRRFLIWLPAYGAALLAGAFGWGHQWSHFNAYLPFVFVEGLVIATALPALAESLGRSSAKLVAMIAAAVLAVQLALLGWSPSRWIPSDSDRRAGDKLIARLAAVDGDVLVPFHPWYAKLAGKKTQVHRMGLMDMRAGGHKVSGLRSAFADQRYAAIVLNKAPDVFPGLRGSYEPDGLLDIDERPRTVTGARTAPAYVWRPKLNGPPPGARVLFNFESGTYTGWIADPAWGQAPVSRKLPRQGAPFGARGRFWASSFHGGDKAVGTLTSPEFEIAGRRITARIGGSKRDTRVELRIGGVAVAKATGTGHRGFAVVEWNVQAHRGKRATIVLVDEAPNGHLNADHFLLWD